MTSIHLPLPLLRAFLIAALLPAPGFGAAAAEPGPAPFNSATFLRDLDVRAGKLLADGRLKPMASLGRPESALKSLTFPAPSREKLEPSDLHDKLSASTLIVGLYYRCHDCNRMHFEPGAGFAVAPGGIVSTCAHMLQFEPKKMREAYPIAINDRGEVFPVVEVIAYDAVGDTCLIRVEGADLPPLPARRGARAGESVYCLSHPGGNNFMFTTGIISRVDTQEQGGRSVHLLDVSCEYSPGSSGGPITDAAGNVVAQVAKIMPTLLYARENDPTSPAATVYNLRVATAADEILRLENPGNRLPLPPPTTAPDAPAVPGPDQAGTKDAVSATTAREIFNVHSRFTIIEAPEAANLEGTRGFQELFAMGHDKPREFSLWSSDDTPSETQQPNFLSVGFTGVTGYYRDPASSGPPSMDNTVSRGIDFKITYHDPKDSSVQAHISINDNRKTLKAADNRFDVEAALTRDVFQMVRLGPPQGGRQAWLGILVDDFNRKAAKIPVEAITMPADHKVDLRFTATDGREVNTATLRGKVILVDFWATWCGSCVESMPLVEDLYQRYRDQGLEVIGVSMDEDRGAVDKFLRKHPHPWPQWFSGASPNPNHERFGIFGIPLFLLIDRTGTTTVIDVRNPDTDEIILEKLRS